MTYLAMQLWADGTWHDGETFDSREDAEAFIAIQTAPKNWRIVDENDEPCSGCERMIDKGVSGNCPVCDAEHVFEDDE